MGVHARRAGCGTWAGIRFLAWTPEWAALAARQMFIQQRQQQIQQQQEQAQQAAAAAAVVQQTQQGQHGQGQRPMQPQPPQHIQLPAGQQMPGHPMIRPDMQGFMTHPPNQAFVNAELVIRKAKHNLMSRGMCGFTF